MNRTIRKERRQKKKDKQARKCHEENTDVAQTTSSFSSSAFQQKGWLKARGRQRTDSTHVLAKIRALNRVLCVWETMRAALNSLAMVAPDWLRAHSQPEWVERYGPRSEDERSPLGEAERVVFAEEIGQQGRELLDAVFDPFAPDWLRAIPVVEILRQVWVQNYQRIDDAVRWRTSREYPSAVPLHRLSLRRRGALQQETGHHLGWIQSASDRKL